MSPYEEYLERGETEVAPTLAKRIVFAILEDLTDRRGLRHEFDQYDDDIKDEIIETWIELIEKELG